MFAVLLVPFGDTGRLVHVFNDLPPSDSGVISAERDLPELRRVGNDAHLRPSEVIVEQILEPHSCDEQEVPWIIAPLLDVVHRAIAGDFPVALPGEPERLIELSDNVGKRQAGWSAEGVVIL